MSIDYATIFSAIAAVAALVAALVGLLSYRLQRRGMRRAQPIVELHGGRNARPPLEGWDERHLVVRNRADAAIIVTGVRLRRWRGQAVCSRDDAETAEGDGSGGPKLKRPADITPMRQATLSRRVGPAGTHGGIGQPGDVLSEQIFVIGVASARDLRLEWHWADGHR
jgi:hypothetical protein